VNVALIKYQDKTISSSSPKPSLLKMSTKDASQTPAKRATHVVEQSPSLSTHLEVVLSKKWTDGSVSWDSLPTALASLGKVLIVQSLEGLALFVFYLFASSVVCEGDDEIFLFTNCNHPVDQAILSVGL
jgi:hypothetical protein